jgi:5S rRNA maturation endonuclease (ribonuclease M5)
LFQTIKEKVNLLEVIQKDTNLEFKLSGDNTYSIVDDEEFGCPLCGHHGCFKVKFSEEDFPSNLFKCFSCDAGGSVIDWTAAFHKLSIVEAGRKLAKDCGITLPKDFSPVQELFNVAAGYYQNAMREVMNSPQSKLARMTPLAYQMEVRKHKDETLKHFQVGYSDGGLIDFLEGLGYDKELIESSGLKGKKGDFLPSHCFIYPHSVRGKVSHFTFKDSAKKLAYQLPNKYVLNGVEFYNQDAIKNFNVIIVVEGENDVLSTFESTNNFGVIGTIGQIGATQLAWMKDNLQGKDVVTIFDPDAAGDKYREKVERLRTYFNTLIHVKPPEEGDIDDMLKSGKPLDEIISSYQVKVEVDINKGAYKPPAALNTPTLAQALSTSEKPPEAGSDPTEEGTVETAPSNKGFFEKFGKYWKVKQTQDGPQYSVLSNFTIQLKNVLLTEEGDRLREITVTRSDGYVSDPIRVSSEHKVSLKAFRVLLARAADADFFGTEADLISMWELTYSKTPEVLINVTRIVGRSDTHKGWILRNKFIADNGMIIDPDENGVFWVNANKVGICPESLNKTGNEKGISKDIPYLVDDKTEEETHKLIQTFVDNLAKNLGCMGTTLTMLGWFNAVAYSNTLFEMNRGFPMLFVNGSNGQGKGTICSWLMSMYSMDGNGKTTIAQLKSGVGFGRRAEYYASLPLFIDEIRGDQETKEYMNTFRSYYDRDGRTMGTREGFGVKTQEVRSCFMFAGEDHFDDPATKERCITVRITSLNREKVESFMAIDNAKEELSAIGYHWIKQASNMDRAHLKTSIKALDKALVTEAGCSSRKSKNWAVVGHFALELAEKYAPGFDMKDFLFKTSTDDTVLQKSETTVNRFFETVESVISQEGVPKITNSHIMTEGNLLHIWYAHVFRVVQESSRNSTGTFSRNAIFNAIKEEPYYVSDTRKVQMGLDGTRRLVLTLDLSKAPDSINNIALGNRQ